MWVWVPSNVAEQEKHSPSSEFMSSELRLSWHLAVPQNTKPVWGVPVFNRQWWPQQKILFCLAAIPGVLTLLIGTSGLLYVVDNLKRHK